MIANYYAITPQKLNEFINFVDEADTEEDILNQLEEIGEEDATDILDIDKLWDGIHFLLTNVSANEPIEGNPLSEAIVGISVVDTEDFIAIIKPQEVESIYKALQDVAIESMIQDLDVKKFEDAEIYPNIWIEEDKEELKEELLATFNNIKEFYGEVLNCQKGVIVSIF